MDPSLELISLLLLIILVDSQSDVLLTGLPAPDWLVLRQPAPGLDRSQGGADGRWNSCEPALSHGHTDIQDCREDSVRCWGIS